jgi:uncharacterized protein (TIGR02594 family)
MGVTFMPDVESDTNSTKAPTSKGRLAAITGAVAAITGTVAAIALFVTNVDKIWDTGSGWIVGKKDQPPPIVINITREVLLEAAAAAELSAKTASGPAKVETEQAVQSLNTAATKLPEPISLNTPSRKVPQWLQLAMKEIGQEEVPGPEHNPRILEYMRSASTEAVSDGDERPWPSYFVNWALAQSGIKGTNSGVARSWLTWGTALEVPQPGAVVVFARPGQPGMGNVGFYLGDAGDQVLCVAGNVGGAVRLTAYPKSLVLGYRWPKDT